MKRKRRATKKNFSLIKEYKESWKYIKESKKFIYLVTVVFLLFLLIGFFIPTPEFLYDEIMKFIRELLAKTQDMSQLDLAGFIIYNNIQSTFLNVVLGIFLGIFPLFDAIANGYMLGFVSSISVNSNGLFSLWRILPHGIFELPAVFISLGLGLKTGMFIFQKDKIKSFKNYLGNSLRAFLLIVIPLLIIAGIIEAMLMTLLK